MEIMSVTSHKFHVISNHKQLDCLFKRLFRLMIQKLQIKNGPLWGESTRDRWFPTQRTGRHIDSFFLSKLTWSVCDSAICSCSMYPANTLVSVFALVTSHLKWAWKRQILSFLVSDATQGSFSCWCGMRHQWPHFKDFTMSPPTSSVRPARALLGFCRGRSQTLTTGYSLLISNHFAGTLEGIAGYEVNITILPCLSEYFYVVSLNNLRW